MQHSHLDELYDSICGGHRAIDCRILRRYYSRQEIIKGKVEVMHIINRLDHKGSIDYEAFRKAFLPIDLSNYILEKVANRAVEEYPVVKKVERETREEKEQERPLGRLE